MKFASIDAETSGLSAESDEIIRLTAVKWSESGEILGFDTWVKPTKPVKNEVKELVGFKDEWYGKFQ